MPPKGRPVRPAPAYGTKYELAENNLLAEYSIRYRAYGGVAYHHMAGTYIALFSHFIPCGVWEVIYILEGLLKNTSDIQPTAVHADTPGPVDAGFWSLPFAGYPPHAADSQLEGPAILPSG